MSSREANDIKELQDTLFLTNTELNEKYHMKTEQEIPNQNERAFKATNFWMGIECLSPNSAPKIEEDMATGSVTWNIASDQELPWNDPIKSRFLEDALDHSYTEMTWRFVAYCAVMEIPPVIEEIRQRLGAEQNELSDYRPGEPAAAIAIPLNRLGYVTDTPFISSMPWALAQLKPANAPQATDFSGFFGTHGFQQRVCKEIKQLMVLQGIVASGSDVPASATPSTPVEPPAQNDVGHTHSKAISLKDIQAICALLFERGGWSPSTTTSLRIQAKRISVKNAEKIEEPDDADMLNSFYAEDIHVVSQAMQSSDVGPALQSYLTAQLRSDRVDIRSANDQTVNHGVLPQSMPLGCWPSQHGLVLAQQFAVNAIRQKLTHTSGMFSVNGPPGTGKTTLLRDVIVGVVVDRAIAMAAFTDPQRAFTTSIEVEGWAYGKVWALDPTLRGQGIVVASANNGAVENITKELPAREALPADCAMDYFSALSDSIAAPKKAKLRKMGATWGMVAAALGRKDNRTDFFQRFRWSEKIAKNEEPHPDRLLSLWDLVEAGHGAKPWAEARASFLAALETSRSAQSRLQHIADILHAIIAAQTDIAEIHSVFTSLSQHMSALKAKRAELSAKAILTRAAHEQFARRFMLTQRWRHATQALSTVMAELASDAIAQASANLRLLEDETVIANLAARSAELLLASHQASKPGWLQSLFNWKVARNWPVGLAVGQQDYKACSEALQKKREALALARQCALRRDALVGTKQTTEVELDSATVMCAQEGIDPGDDLWMDSVKLESAKALSRDTAAALLAVETDLAAAEDRSGKARKKLSASENTLQIRHGELGNLKVTQEMARAWLCVGMSEDDKQLAVPWFAQEFFSARQALFGAAMALHASFIVHSWPKLKNTLNALVSLNSGAVAATSVTGGVAQLWEALFLVVPVVSTTFASFPRMFQGWGREDIGWLLIDEAGQAAPQQALGAIWRSKRVVVVGDPLQLEPIVALPLEALEPLRKRCGADMAYSPRVSSAQGLADMANSIGTLIGSGDAAQWVGSPLRVHRRCLQPMFEISNTIAYDGMMVYGTAHDERDAWCGKSCWIDMPANDPVGNCIPQQVNEAIRIVDLLVKEHGIRTGEKFNMYVITPFRDVDAHVDRALYSKFKGAKKGMHGTVHTFQGKEADVVIIVLGGDPRKPGLIPYFAAAKPNLLNVAITRAKKRVYVIGDHDQWSKHRYFETLARTLPIRRDISIARY
jgi:AAA domain